MMLRSLTMMRKKLPCEVTRQLHNQPAMTAGCLE